MRLLLGVAGVLAWAAAAAGLKKPNVLFVALDDLRPALGCAPN